MSNTKEVLIEGLDVIDVLGEVSRKNRKFAAIFLNELDEIIPDIETKKKIRKLYLDTLNNYSRSIVRMIFGDIEGFTDGEKTYSKPKENPINSQ